MDLMDECEEMMLSVSHDLGLGDKITYQGREMDLKRPWERITVKDLPKRFKEKSRNLHSSKTKELAEHAKEDITATLSLKETERNLIERTLKACKGNKSKAAKKLGISRTRLYKELDRFGLKELE